MQTSVWGQVKSKGVWNHEIMGLFWDEDLIASTLLLWRKLPVVGKRLYYAPRGFIIDFNDRETLAVFTRELRKHLLTNKGVYCIVDPDVHYRELDQYDNVLKERDDFVERMVSLGYRHRGFTMNFDATQPRFTFRLYLNGTHEEIYDRFDRFNKKNLRQCADNAVEVYEADDIDLFYDILADTARRDHFIENPKEYYKGIYDALRPLDMCRMYFAKYTPARHLALIDEQLIKAEEEILGAKERIRQKDTSKARTQLQQAEEKKERTLKMRRTAEEYEVRYPDGIVLSAVFDINTKHRGWTVYGGSRAELREMNGNYGVTYESIRAFTDRGMEFMDFFGTVGYPDENSKYFGIHRFKKKFSGTYVEFPGEFHLVADKLLYLLWVKAYPKVLKAYKALYKVLRKKK